MPTKLTKEVITNEMLGESYELHRHPSGLTILLYPMPQYSSSFALFGTKMGSVDTVFRTEGQATYTEVPEGIAHFLEHKLFESEDGDAFSLFAKTGASANAYTSFDRTCYLFSTTRQFSQSLGDLLRFVQSPYFTQETVEKEQGIIGQEIKMYQDNPDWRVFFNLLTALYQHHPVRLDIAGTVESIAKIDADLLYQCYHTFYNLNNMVLAIAGNFDPAEALTVIEEQIKEKEPIRVEQKIPDEPMEIHRKEITQSLSVSIPLFQIGFKQPPKTGRDLLKTQLCAEMLLSVVAGEGSILYRDLYEQGLINQTFQTEVFSGRGFFACIFGGESRQPETVYQRICEEIQRLKQEGIDPAHFSGAKKALYGRTISAFNRVDAVANALVSSFFSGFDLFEHLTAIQDITCDDATAFLRDAFALERSALSIVKPQH